MSGHYTYLQDLLALAECTEHDCPIKWPVCPSPIRAGNWAEFLHSHPDQVFASYIATGLEAVFRIGYNRGGPRLRPSSSNHPSALANAQVVADYIKAEVEVGRLVGPLGERVLPLVADVEVGRLVGSLGERVLPLVAEVEVGRLVGPLGERVLPLVADVEVGRLVGSLGERVLPLVAEVEVGRLVGPLGERVLPLVAEVEVGRLVGPLGERVLPLVR